MSVHQIEQYYIHIGADEFNQDCKEQVLEFLNNCDEPLDFEVTESIVIDGFESYSDAESFEAELNALITKQKQGVDNES